jgi:1,4-alpha-glucan branching enzyme
VRPDARAVFVAGSFNQWQPASTPLKVTAGGRWSVELELAPGAYEYRFVVDGQWIADPAASESVPNPFAGVNSVLRVNPPLR